MARTKTSLAPSVRIDAVRRCDSRYVRSGFAPGGAANRAGALVGGVEMWWNLKGAFSGNASANRSASEGSLEGSAISVVMVESKGCWNVGESASDLSGK